MLVFRTTDTFESIANDTGMATYDFAALSDDNAILFVLVGSELRAGFCGDTIAGDTDKRYHAIEGTATLSATSSGGSGHRVTLSLSSITFGLEFGDERVSLSSLELGPLDISP